MSLFYAVSLVSLIWAVIHALYRLLKPKSALLPTLNSHKSRAWTLWADKSTTITVNKLHIRIQTNYFNSEHDQLSGKLNDRRFSRLRRWLLIFYNCGVVAGICGMLLALAAFAWMSIGLFIHPLEKLPNLSKRDFSSLDQGTHSTSLIQPIIPGVTVPLGHLPIILFAVLGCQIIHELGHAIAGALDSVPILSSGLAVTLVIPSAFVSFSAGFMSSLNPIEKGRVIAAGPWHNFVLWTVLVVSGRSAVFVEDTTGLGSALVSIGWKDISKEGRVVIGLDDDSPLQGILNLGSVITALDDLSLMDKEDRWSEHLMQKKPYNVPWNGWCVSRQIFQVSLSECCKDPHPASDHICFESLGSYGKTCLDPIPIITASEPQLRCRRESDCGRESVCTRPDSSSSILRLSVQGQETILWSGPRHEIWEQVSIGRYIPRFWFIPLQAIYVFGDFWDYLQMATLSLFFFNLLPLPLLDGAQFLSALLDYLRPQSVPTVDAESGISQRGTTLWKQRFERFVHYGTLSLVVLYLTLSLLQTQGWL